MKCNARYVGRAHSIWKCFLSFSVFAAMFRTMATVRKYKSIVINLYTVPSPSRYAVHVDRRARRITWKIFRNEKRQKKSFVIILVRKMENCRIMRVELRWNLVWPDEMGASKNDRSTQQYNNRWNNFCFCSRCVCSAFPNLPIQTLSQIEMASGNKTCRRRRRRRRSRRLNTIFHYLWLLFI